MSRPFPIDRASHGFARTATSVALVLFTAVGAVSVSSADDTDVPAPPAVPVAPDTSPPAVPPSDETVPALPLPSAPANDGKPDVKPGAPSAPSSGKTFATREAAAAAFFAAFEANDDAALRDLMGSGHDDVVQDGKDPIVEARRTELAAAAKSKLTYEAQPDGRVLLVIGTRAYPLPIPLVSTDGVWRLDAAAGRQELLTRRIGENELEAIGICLAYADAQVEYASKDRNGDGVKEYAQRLVSTPGTQDGLYWATVDEADVSPAGPGLTPLRDALTHSSSSQTSFDGYTWRILTSQGSNAPGGAFSYVINGRTIAGFALLAVPAVHRNTGVMSFLVSNQGKVYEKDLGADTLKVAATLTTFDPDPSWREVDEATLLTASATSPEDVPFDDPEGDLVPSTGPLGAGGDDVPADADGDRVPSGAPAPGQVPATSPMPPCLPRK